MSIEEYNYWHDPRTIASMKNKLEFDEKKMRIFVKIEKDCGEEYVGSFPARFEVCNLCSGKGKHVSSAIDSSGLTDEDLDDYSFREDYFDGIFDTTCNQCMGNRIIPIPNKKAFMSEQEKNDLALWEKNEAEEYAYARMCAAERAMGA